MWRPERAAFYGRHQTFSFPFCPTHESAKAGLSFGSHFYAEIAFPPA
jgi:hypothetical protein